MEVAMSGTPPVVDDSLAPTTTTIATDPVEVEATLLTMLQANTKRYTGVDKNAPSIITPLHAPGQLPTRATISALMNKSARSTASSHLTKVAGQDDAVPVRTPAEEAAYIASLSADLQDKYESKSFYNNVVAEYFRPLQPSDLTMVAPTPVERYELEAHETPSLNLLLQADPSFIIPPLSKQMRSKNRAGIQTPSIPSYLNDKIVRGGLKLPSTTPFVSGLRGGRQQQQQQQVTGTTAHFSVLITNTSEGRRRSVLCDASADLQPLVDSVITSHLNEKANVSSFDPDGSDNGTGTTSSQSETQRRQQASSQSTVAVSSSDQQPEDDPFPIPRSPSVFSAPTSPAMPNPRRQHPSSQRVPGSGFSSLQSPLFEEAQMKQEYNVPSPITPSSSSSSSSLPHPLTPARDDVMMIDASSTPVNSKTPRTPAETRALQAWEEKKASRKLQREKEKTTSVFPLTSQLPEDNMVPVGLVLEDRGDLHEPMSLSADLPLSAVQVTSIVPVLSNAYYDANYRLCDQIEEGSSAKGGRKEDYVLLEQLEMLQYELSKQVEANSQRRAKLRNNICVFDCEASVKMRNSWVSDLMNKYLYICAWQIVRKSLQNGMKDITYQAPTEMGLAQTGLTSVGLGVKRGADVDGKGGGGEEEGQEDAHAEFSVCTVCFDGDSNETNPIVFCDRCNLSVHKFCYGIDQIPEEDWMCKWCTRTPVPISSNVEGGRKKSCKADLSSGAQDPYHCVLCPVLGGPLKPTDNNRWCHINCALWTPLASVISVTHMEPIVNIHQAILESICSDALCAVCQLQHGACVKCHDSDCQVFVHMLCGWYNGLYMKVTSEGVSSIFTFYCSDHAPHRELTLLPPLSATASASSLPGSASSGKSLPLYSPPRPSSFLASSAAAHPPSVPISNESNPLPTSVQTLRIDTSFGKNHSPSSSSSTSSSSSLTLLEHRQAVELQQRDMRCRGRHWETDTLHQSAAINARKKRVKHILNRERRRMKKKDKEDLYRSGICCVCFHPDHTAPKEKDNLLLAAMLPSSSAASVAARVLPAISRSALIQCDRCDIEVHPACYGVSDEDVLAARHYDATGLGHAWYCAPCAKKMVDVRCLLCPRQGGAFKPMPNGKAWVHLVCALWIPEVSVDHRTMTVLGSDSPSSQGELGGELGPKWRHKLTCGLCDRKQGACLQCSDTCLEPFHPLCGKLAGIYMESTVVPVAVDESKSSGGQEHERFPLFASSCATHTLLHLSSEVNVPSTYSRMVLLRGQLDTARTLLDLVRRREKIKQQLIKNQQKIDESHFEALISRGEHMPDTCDLTMQEAEAAVTACTAPLSKLLEGTDAEEVDGARTARGGAAALTEKESKAKSSKRKATSPKGNKNKRKRGASSRDETEDEEETEEDEDEDVENDEDEDEDMEEAHVVVKRKYTKKKKPTEKAARGGKNSAPFTPVRGASNSARKKGKNGVEPFRFKIGEEVIGDNLGEGRVATVVDLRRGNDKEKQLARSPDFRLKKQEGPGYEDDEVKLHFSGMAKSTARWHNQSVVLSKNSSKYQIKKMLGHLNN